MGFIERLNDEKERLKELDKIISEDLNILAQKRFTMSVDEYIELHKKYETGSLIPHGSRVMEYGEPPPDEERKESIFKDWVEGFFRYFDERISLFDSSKISVTNFLDIATREICTYIDIMAFNCLYAEYRTEAGKRFKAFLSRYSTFDDFKIDVIWRFNRNIYIHAGDPPPGLPVNFMELLTVAKKSISKFEEQCIKIPIDPAPLVFRVHNLIRLKVNSLNDLKKRWEEDDEKDENRYLGYLNQIREIWY